MIQANKKNKNKKTIKKFECPTTLLKKRLWQRCFPVNFAKFLRTLFFIEPASVVVSVMINFK